MTRSSPRVEVLTAVNWAAVAALHPTLTLLEDRVLTLLDVVTVLAGMFAAVPLLWEGLEQKTWLGPWDEVIRVVFALLLVIGAIPGIVHIWVVLKNRRSKVGRLQSKIG